MQHRSRGIRAARALGAVHDIEKWQEVGHLADALPELAVARDTVLAGHPALDDPAMKGGQVGCLQRATVNGLHQPLDGVRRGRAGGGLARVSRRQGTPDYDEVATVATLHGRARADSTGALDLALGFAAVAANFHSCEPRV